METQTAIDFDLAAPTVESHVEMVRVLLSRGQWLTPWEMQEEIWRTRGIRVSESGLTARIRDCRKPEYGSHVVLIRKRSGSKSYEYRIGDKA